MRLFLWTTKTDREKEAGELKKRYEKQLAYYQQALERTTGEESERENYLFAGTG